MKAQMKFQKIMCLVMLLVGALSAIYCFIYCTGPLANIGVTLSKKDGLPDYDAVFGPAQELYVDVQPFNTALLILSIVMIVAAAVLYITATNKRRNYYISNYVATGLVCGVDVAVSLYVFIQNSIFLGRFNNLMSDPVISGEFKRISESRPDVEYVTSTWTFALGYVVYIIVIAACAALIFNLIWKIKLMKGEKMLLNGQSTVEEVA